MCRAPEIPILSPTMYLSISIFQGEWKFNLLKVPETLGTFGILKALTILTQNMKQIFPTP
jgi:hypothetical protein